MFCMMAEDAELRDFAGPDAAETGMPSAADADGAEDTSAAGEPTTASDAKGYLGNHPLEFAVRRKLQLRHQFHLDADVIPQPRFELVHQVIAE